MKSSRLIVLIGLFFCWLASSVCAGGLGQVSGQLQAASVESCRGMVSLWPVDDPSVANPGRYNSIPLSVAELSADCRFTIKAEPGKYLLRGVIRNSPGPNWGPLRSGDLIFMSPDGEGKLLQVELDPQLPLDVGTKRSYLEFTGFVEQAETGVAGQLVDGKGQPVAGMVVQAYNEPNMASRPLAVSEPSDGNGHFLLRLKEGGNIYLQAREQIGIGLPLVGRLYGVYGGKVAQAIRLPKGEVEKGVQILVAPRAAAEP